MPKMRSRSDCRSGYTAKLLSPPSATPPALKYRLCSGEIALQPVRQFDPDCISAREPRSCSVGFPTLTVCGKYAFPERKSPPLLQASRGQYQVQAAGAGVRSSEPPLVHGRAKQQPESFRRALPGCYLSSNIIITVPHFLKLHSHQTSIHHRLGVIWSRFDGYRAIKDLLLLNRPKVDPFGHPVTEEPHQGFQVEGGES